MKIEELRIPAPWGHIAAKSWGCSNDYVILVHGNGDNAGGFDGLIPLLPSNYTYISIDLPGHGLSPPFPKSHPVHVLDIVLVIKIVFNYFEKNDYVLIGHSMGAISSMLYTMIYPDKVKKLVTLDMAGPYSYSPVQYANILLNQFVLVDEVNLNKNAKKCLSFEEWTTKLMKIRGLNKKAAESLMTRMLRLSDNDLYYIEYDKRGKSIIGHDGLKDHVIEMYKERPIKCPFLIILSTQFPTNMVYLDLRRFLTKKGVKIEIVNGNHDVHINYPEILSGFVSSFLISTQNKL
ncbi:probable serine hydrolase isoform X3 [Onthophagus taurus]|uniref:probable serine hydrolase isoform X3 n=1 Tax=Onthophagus taurus TaxID=166361 RepID=UPI000C1FF73E|nr:probable serine hydrolase isoform X1 [Onthophagus taurus]